MERYAKGVLFVWTMPENYCDLYLLPPSVTGAIKDQVMRGFPVRLDGPGQVALFAYDNNTFIVESYLPTATDVKVSVTRDFTQLRNLVTGELRQKATAAGNKTTAQTAPPSTYICCPIPTPCSRWRNEFSV